MSQQLKIVESTETASASVQCLGMMFPNDGERRAYFTKKLREKLVDPEFRRIEGFPIGDDEGILAMSDVPYCTACPNPFLTDFVTTVGTAYTNADQYHREPFTADVSEGKTDPLYTAHAYHTKVPHKAIMRYILHYTNPGDIVCPFREPHLRFFGGGRQDLTIANPDRRTRDGQQDSRPQAGSILAGHARPTSQRQPLHPGVLPPRAPQRAVILCLATDDRRA